MVNDRRLLIGVLGGRTYASPFVEKNDTIEIPTWKVDQNLNLSKLDLMVFCGGTDVNSLMYGELPHPANQAPDTQRDLVETYYFKKCVELNIPILGICRGSQFLTVMNGGKLVQHITDHAIYETHKVTNLLSGDVFEITSTHHQMMYPWSSKEEFQLVAVANEKPLMAGKPSRFSIPEHISKIPEVEIVYWPKSRSLCIQGHPEHMPRDSSGYLEFKDLMWRYFCVEV